MEFDAGKGYKRISFREDRDLLDTELNELQAIAIHERTVLMDRLFAPGSIVAGLEGIVNGNTVLLNAGMVYLDGHAVSVPEATLAFTDPGIHTIWLDVFRRIITMADDPTLVNPLTGEPTAEREKWIATLQTRDTTHDPWPEGAIGRTVVALYAFNRDTGELLPAVPSVVQPDDPAWLAAHVGHGGTAQHPVVTPAEAGFMAPADKTKLDQLSPSTPPTHTHDDRYYTEFEADAQLATKADVGHQHDTRYAPLAHVGTGDAAHAAASSSHAGFLSAADKAKLDQLSPTTPPTHTHDERYYPRADADALLATKAPVGHTHDTAYAPLTHVGAGGAVHALATTAAPGFMSAVDKTLLAGLGAQRPYWEIEIAVGISEATAFDACPDRRRIGMLPAPGGGGQFVTRAHTSVTCLRMPILNTHASATIVTFHVGRTSDRLYHRLNGGDLIDHGVDTTNTSFSVSIPSGPSVLELLLANSGDAGDSNLILADWFTPEVIYRAGAGYYG